MRKVFVSFCMAATVAGISSCGSTKSAATLTDISGEWDIVEVRGVAVAPIAGQAQPFIGFDTDNGRVSGNAGCNRIVGSFELEAAPGTIDLSGLGTTRMMCPDMALEDNVLSALRQVKKYAKLSEQELALCGNSLKRPVLVLRRKVPALTVADLNGRWRIVEACGVAVSEGMESQPFVEIDVAEGRVHGNAGCNVFNGGIVTEEGNTTSISFPQLITTMMACPNIEVEDRVKKGLTTTVSFGRLANGNVGLYDAANTLVVVLER